jgi:hypothetical protein
MFKGRGVAVALLAAWLGSGWTGSARADDEAPGDILGLFDQFVSSGAAASRCASPSEEVAVRFLSNFQWVSTHAREEISRQSPAASFEEVVAQLALRSLTVKSRTHALVKAEGCQSDAVQALMRRFVVQATWQPESA